MLVGETSTKSAFIDNTRNVYQLRELQRGRACKFAGKQGDSSGKGFLADGNRARI